jgi:hypothetical protein
MTIMQPKIILLGLYDKPQTIYVHFTTTIDEKNQLNSRPDVIGNFTKCL